MITSAGGRDRVRNARSRAARLRPLSGSVTIALVLATTAPAFADAPSDEQMAEVGELEQIHRDAIRTRRNLGTSVLVGGLTSIAAGGALIIPDGDDLAWRYAGVNTALFGAINTVVGLLALKGIAAEEHAWQSDGARAARRTPEGATRARIHAASDERRESAGHAINLGLGCAYLGIGGTAVLASQLGVERPNRWLASGVAISVQALFLVAIDFVGLANSARYHRAFLDGFTPSLSVVPSSAGTTTHVGVGGAF